MHLKWLVADIINDPEAAELYVRLTFSAVLSVLTAVKTSLWPQKLFSDHETHISASLS